MKARASARVDENGTLHYIDEFGEMLSIPGVEAPCPGRGAGDFGGREDLHEAYWDTDEDGVPYDDPAGASSPGF